MQQQIRALLEEKGKDVESIGPDASVADAVRRMNERHIGALLVIEGDRPVGIFTERDVLVRVVAERLDPDTTGVRDVMTTTLVVVTPTTTVEEAMVITTHKRCRHLPVMNGSELVGLVSAGDLTRSLIKNQQADISDLTNYITSG